MTASAVGGGVPALTPSEALALFLTNAAIVNGTQITAVTNLTNSLDSAGLWPKMRAIYPLVGGTAASHSFNLKNPLDADAANRVAWAGTVTHDANGATGSANGTGNTFLNPSLIPALDSNIHISCYCRTNATSTSGVAIGAGVSPTVRLNPKGGAGYANVHIQGAGTGLGDAANADPLGLTIGNKISPTTMRTLQKGALLGEISYSYVAFPVFALRLLSGTTNAGAANNFDPRNYAWLSIGTSLSVQNETDLYTIVQAYQTALSRNV